MNSVPLKTGHRRLAVALALVGVAMLVFASVAGAQSSPSEYPPPPPSPLAPPDWDGGLLPLLGDVNQSNTLTVADARLLMQAIARITTLGDSQWAVGDVNNSGSVTVADARLMMQYIARMPVVYWNWPNDAIFRDPGGSNAG